MDQIQPQPTIAPAPKKSVFPIFFVVLILTLLTATGIFAYQNMQLQKQIVILQSQPTPTPLLSPTPQAKPDPAQRDTTNWKTYTNSKLGFSIQYPSNLRVSQEPQPYKNNLGGTTWLLSIDDRADGDVAGKTIRTSILVQFNDKPISGESGLPITKIENTVMGIENAIYLNIQNYPAVKGRQKLNPDQNGVAQETTLFVTILQDKLLWSIRGNIKSTKDVEINTVDQILSTFRFVNSPVTTSPTSSLLPSGWTARAFPTYSLTLYSPSNWKSNIQDYPKTSSSLIRFWQGATPDTATIQLDIKDSWANTGDAPYLPKNYTVNGNIAAVRVDPPQKTEKTLDRYQTNVYFEHGSKTYVFTCVHNWIPEQLQICNTMLQTIQFSQ